MQNILTTIILLTISLLSHVSIRPLKMQKLSLSMVSTSTMRFMAVVNL